MRELTEKVRAVWFFALFDLLGKRIALRLAVSHFNTGNASFPAHDIIAISVVALDLAVTGEMLTSLKLLLGEIFPIQRRCCGTHLSDPFVLLVALAG